MLSVGSKNWKLLMSVASFCNDFFIPNFVFIEQWEIFELKKRENINCQKAGIKR